MAPESSRSSSLPAASRLMATLRQHGSLLVRPLMVPSLQKLPLPLLLLLLAGAPVVRDYRSMTI